MRRQKGFVSVVAGLCAAIGIVPSVAAEAGCEGFFPNPVTDVCWSCLFPMRIAGTRLSPEGVSDPDTDARVICTCQRGPVAVPGFNMSFWEPLRTVEVVREPYCLVSLGGVSMDPGLKAPRTAEALSVPRALPLPLRAMSAKTVRAVPKSARPFIRRIGTTRRGFSCSKQWSIRRVWKTRLGILRISRNSIRSGATRLPRLYWRPNRRFLPILWLWLPAPWTVRRPPS